MEGNFSKEELDSRSSLPLSGYSSVDFTKLKGADLLAVCRDDGMAWAYAFCQITKKGLDIDIDPMYVWGWFCNAIENSSQLRKREWEKLNYENRNQRPTAG